jgi:nucleolar protein 58
MLILVETAAGYALFDLKDKGIMKEVDTIADHFNNADNANNCVSLKAFKKFKNTKEALKSTLKIINAKLPKSLKKFIKKNIVSKQLTDSLALSDKRLCQLVKDKFSIKCKNNKKTHELMRGIKS